MYEKVMEVYVTKAIEANNLFRRMHLDIFIIRAGGGVGEDLLMWFHGRSTVGRVLRVVVLQHLTVDDIAAKLNVIVLCTVSGCFKFRGPGGDLQQIRQSQRRPFREPRILRSRGDCSRE